MSTFTTSDKVEIYYEVTGEGKPLLFLPGWSCSIRFFDKNIKPLSDHYKVIAMDMRGHGKSQTVKHGHRIARYAKDLQELLEQLDLKDVTAIGWSMGVAVLWSNLELFPHDRISKLVCIDQSPAQYIGPDWKWGQTGCYDVETFTRLCCDIQYAEQATAEGLIHGCMHKEPSGEEVKRLSSEIMKCSAHTKIEIMRDHTNLDWRDLLPTIDIPTLVMVARNSKVFPWQGSAYVGETIPGSRTEFFEESGHMLFWEESEKFNTLIRAFVE